MEIKGKVHCFFEQSGTFKNEFIKLGIPAEDYDIQNNFGQTDHYDDLFQAIEDAYEGKPSLFDNISKDDLIIAFFPCIYFCDANEYLFSAGDKNYAKLSEEEKIEKILYRAKEREKFFETLIKLVGVCIKRGTRLIIENPYSQSHYLVKNFPYKPKVIDRNRRLRGDWFTKPTQYWFINCDPTYGRSFTNSLIHKSINKCKGGAKQGICSEERSMISPDYARNFICDFILGRPQPEICPTLFDAM